MHYVYVLLSEKDYGFYTGYTSDLRRRFAEHEKGQVSSTQLRRPFKLIYYEASLSQQDATRREKYLKSGNGKIYLKNRLKQFLEQNPTGVKLQDDGNLYSHNEERISEPEISSG
jgi:putative endonuclease